MLNKFHFKVFLTLIASMLFISACGTAPTPKESPISSNELPSWVTNPQNDTQQYMYGVAINRDRDTAVKDALVNMVSKLGVSIQSTYESNQEVSKYYDKSVSTNKIKSDVAKIKVNNYEIVQSQRLSYKEFAVMIQTDKKKFYEGLVEELDAHKKSIEQRLNFLKDDDTLKRYNVKKKLSLEAEGLKSNILILSALDKSFDKNSYLDFVSQIEKEFMDEQKELSFYVEGDAKSAGFVNSIKKYLAQKGFKLANNQKKNSLHVKINSMDNIIEDSSMDIAVLRINIDVYDKIQEIGGKDIILKERYNGSISNVYKNASIHFEQDMESLGINEAIGININIE